MKKRGLIIVLVVLLGIGVLRLPIVHGLTGIAHKTIQIVNSTGTVINGTASGVTGTASETVNVADSTGHILDSFGASIPGNGAWLDLANQNSIPFSGLDYGIWQGNTSSTMYFNAAGHDVAWEFDAGPGTPIFQLPGDSVQSAHPLPPNAGGVGKMTSAPMWARYYGDGSDGAGPASGAISTPWPKQFTGWTCTGAMTFSATGVVILSQGSVNLNTGCSLKRTTGTAGVGTYGGGGGSGGAGAASSAAASAANYFGALVSSGGALSAAAGNDGGVLSASAIRSMAIGGVPWSSLANSAVLSGGAGSAGGSSGGAAGNGGIGVVIIAPSINIASGVTIDTSGLPGTAAAANSTGAGGGGGGAPIILVAQTITDNGGIYKYGGGPGGAITAPSIQATGGGCDSGANGCGKDAAFTITALSSGGLSAGSITIANAGSGYQTAPDCTVNAGASGLTGSPACHFTLSGGTIASVVIDTAGSGGTLSTFTTAFIGGYGANGFMKELLIQ